VDFVLKKAERPRPGAGAYKVFASIRNPEQSYQDYFLLVAVEIVAAPREVTSELVGKDLTQTVAWSYLATTRNMSCQVVHDMRGEEERRLEVFELDPDQVVKGSFSDPADTLWPWAFRVTVYMVDRYGATRGKNYGVLRYPPPGK